MSNATAESEARNAPRFPCTGVLLFNLEESIDLELAC